MSKINANDDYSHAINSVDRLKECVELAYWNLAGIEATCEAALLTPYEAWTEETFSSLMNRIKELSLRGQNK